MKREPLRLIPKERSATKLTGFSLIEVLLTGAVFALLVSALAGTYLYGQEATALAGNRARAILLAEEGMEAVRNIRDAAYGNLTNGTFGLTTTGNQWNLAGGADTQGIFTRTVSISSLDDQRKSVTVNVAWQQNPQRTGVVTLMSRFTNWQDSVSIVATCAEYAVQQGYGTGTCRQNSQQCERNGEMYLAGGDPYCVTSFPGDPSRDTCCVIP